MSLLRVVGLSASRCQVVGLETVILNRNLRK
jgi:hypothetical protein